MKPSEIKRATSAQRDEEKKCLFFVHILKKFFLHFFSCVHNTLVESSRLSLAVFSHVSLSGIITVPVDSVTVRARINCELA